MRLHIRSSVLVLVIVLLLGTASPSVALTVVISQGSTTLFMAQSLITQDPGTGVLTTIVDLSGIPAGIINGFTIACSLCTDPTTFAALIPRAIGEQSASVERITLDNITVTAPVTCSAATPCSLTITAVADPSDFVGKPSGPYPSGVFMSGFFKGTDSVFTSPAGDSLAGVGLGQGDVINATPGGGPADTQVSLPSSCTGSPSCQFTATLAKQNFVDQIAETIQLNCGEVATCPAALTSGVTVTFVNPGDSVDLPFGAGQSRTPVAAPLLTGGVLIPFGAGAPFAAFSPVVAVSGSFSNFRLTAPFTLNAASDGIDPLREFVNFGVGPFATTIPPGSFRRTGPFFSFEGSIKGVGLEAKLIPRGGADWEFQVNGHDVDLTGIQNPLPVSLTIKDDTGNASVEADLR